MSKPITLLAIYVFASCVLSACNVGKSSTFKVINNGDYKIVIRSVEPLHSGIHNIDICVLAISDTEFPKRYRKAQCFFQGYDLDGLAVKWLSPHYIGVDITDGWVSEFRNHAAVQEVDSPRWIGFHISLYDRSAHPDSSAQQNVIIK